MFTNMMYITSQRNEIMYTVLALEEYLLCWALLAMIYIAYHGSLISMNILQTLWLAFTFGPKMYWCLLGPHSKGNFIWSILFNSHCPPKSLQNEQFSAQYQKRKLTCNDSQFNIMTGLQVSGNSIHHAQQMNWQVVQAINYATLYKPIHDQFYLAAAYNKIAEGLKQPPDCFILWLTVTIAILLVFLVLIMSQFLKLFVSNQSLPNTSISKLSNCLLRVKSNKQKWKHKQNKQDSMFSPEFT